MNAGLSDTSMLREPAHTKGPYLDSLILGWFCQLFFNHPKHLTSNPKPNTICLDPPNQASMQDLPIDPLAIVPSEYPLILSQSFGSACGLTALLIVLETLPEDQQNEIKRRMMGAWKKMWMENFQEGITRYSETLSKISHADALPQPEELQLGFNRALGAAEKSAKISLGMGVEK